MRNSLLLILKQIHVHFFPSQSVEITPIKAPHDFRAQYFSLGWKLLFIRLGFFALSLIAIYFLFEQQIDAVIAASAK